MPSRAANTAPQSGSGLLRGGKFPGGGDHLGFHEAKRPHFPTLSAGSKRESHTFLVKEVCNDEIRIQKLCSLGPGGPSENGGSIVRKTAPVGSSKSDSRTVVLEKC